MHVFYNNENCLRVSFPVVSRERQSELKGDTDIPRETEGDRGS